ncbi:MAG: EAL domain-containing protein [Pseudomonadota bacterium]
MAFEFNRPGSAALDVLYGLVAAIELTPGVAVHAIDGAGTVRFWNNACVSLFGIPAADAVGHPLAKLITHPGAEEQFQATLDTVWHSGQPAPPRDWQVALADGKRMWIRSTIFPLRHVESGAQQIFCMDVDITGIKEGEVALAAAGSNFRGLFERSIDAIVLIERNSIIDANPAALRLFGAPAREDMAGKTLLDFSPPLQAGGVASAEREAELIEQTLHDGNLRYEWQYQTRDGKPFWAEVLMTSVSLDHEYLAYAVIRDISARKNAERSLFMAAQVFENCRDAIVITDAQYRIVAVNQAFTDITGYRPSEIVGEEAPRLRSTMHDAEFYQQLRRHVDLDDHWSGEIWSQRKGGEVFPVWVALTAIRDNSGAVSYYMAILSDITDRKRREDQTRHLAEHDFLTDLPNRVLLFDRAHQALAQARRQQGKVAVLFLDLDRFKAINDNYGHPVGDLVLKEVAQRLARCVRGVDTVSRQGGDEFVIILADIGGGDQAAHVAGTVMQAVAGISQVAGVPVSLSVSIGISLYPHDGDDCDTLFANADVAMYHAKQSGRNDFRFFNPAMNAHVVEHIELENKLRQALSNGEFVLDYLPEVDIASGRTVAVEALIRWHHPQRGVLAPDEFLKLAEDCGLIVPIGEWVLAQACQRARSWRDAGFPVVVAVNLSSVQFIHPHLLESIDKALAHSGLEPQFLDLDITEEVVMNSDTATMTTIGALRARGVQLTIDDFGTGLSSLSGLRRCPLNKLKIDRSFVEDITRAPGDAAMIPAIIAVARSLKLRVVAEGVETAEQLRFLQQHGCDEYQGFYAGVASPDPDLTPRRP